MKKIKIIKITQSQYNVLQYFEKKIISLLEEKYNILEENEKEVCDAFCMLPVFLSDTERHELGIKNIHALCIDPAPYHHKGRIEHYKAGDTIISTEETISKTIERIRIRDLKISNFGSYVKGEKTEIKNKIFDSSFIATINTAPIEKAIKYNTILKRTIANSINIFNDHLKSGINHINTHEILMEGSNLANQNINSIHDYNTCYILLDKYIRNFSRKYILSLYGKAGIEVDCFGLSSKECDFDNNFKFHPQVNYQEALSIISQSKTHICSNINYSEGHARIFDSISLFCIPLATGCPDLKKAHPEFKKQILTPDLTIESVTESYNNALSILNNQELDDNIATLCKSTFSMNNLATAFTNSIEKTNF